MDAQAQPLAAPHSFRYTDNTAQLTKAKKKNFSNLFPTVFILFVIFFITNVVYPSYPVNSSLKERLSSHLFSYPILSHKVE
jgi:Na+/proline symporter